MNQKLVHLLGVPSDFGANIQGACMGPAAIRIAGLKQKIEKLGYAASDLGDISVPIRDTLTEDAAADKYLKPIVEICQGIAKVFLASLKMEALPILLGGDHSLAIGSISGSAKYFAQKKQKMGLIWVDAHADMNTPQSSPSLNIHGMPLSVLLGDGHPDLCNIGIPGRKVDPANVVLLAARTLDDFEKDILRKSGIACFTMRNIDEKGIFNIMEQAIKIASNGTAGIHLSFDIDSIDPMYAPGVSTPVSGGLAFREAHLLLEMLYETGKLCSMDFVELNPLRDVDSRACLLTIDLILSALGKSIV
jgi:arginase